MTGFRVLHAQQLLLNSAVPCRARGRQRRCIDCLCAAHCTTAPVGRLLRMFRLTCAVTRARKRKLHNRGRSTPERSLKPGILRPLLRLRALGSADDSASAA